MGFFSFGSEIKAQRIIQVPDDDVSPASESDIIYEASSVKGNARDCKIRVRKSCALMQNLYTALSTCLLRQSDEMSIQRGRQRAHRTTVPNLHTKMSCTKAPKHASNVSLDYYHVCGAGQEKATAEV